MNNAKDSDEVITFMALFQKLRDRIGDNPDILKELGTDDPDIQAICEDIRWARFYLNIIRPGDQRGHYTAPVDPRFIEAYREYDTRYYQIIKELSFSDWGNGVEVEKKSRSDFVWQEADSYADEWSYVIEGAIDFAEKHAFFLMDPSPNTIFFYDENGMLRTKPGPESGLNLPEELVSDAGGLGAMPEGADAWRRLKDETGFNLQEVFRRYLLTPFVLIPRHVAQHYGDSEKLSLLTNLRQAQEAFIFGVPFAALALMRSVMEVTLKMHYQALGSDLSQMIDNCTNLPDRCSKKTLDKIRRLANDILHVNSENVPLPKDFDQEIVRLLNALRALIEGAPARRR
ncbi:MAG: DUF4145 domain-containing protein [Pseudomonadota bacterium]